MKLCDVQGCLFEAVEEAGLCAIHAKDPYFRPQEIAGRGPMADMTPVDKDSPLWIAWERYSASEDYANTRLWALVPAYVDGSLWAAFEAGYRAAQETREARAEGTA